VGEVLEHIVSDIPAPKISDESKTRALIFDSYYDDYRGVILYVRVFDGKLSQNDQIKMMATGASGIALEVGALKPEMTPNKSLKTGEIGYIVTNLKTTREAKVGDTITLVANASTTPLPGYKDVKPFVYAGFFPESNEFYQELKDAVEKLSLSDSALQFAPENSPVLGFGMRIGFLGLLHMDIVRERLEREYNLELVVTNPSTDYQIKLTSGQEIDIKSATDLPDMVQVEEIREPWVNGEIVVPQTYVGPVIQLISSKRGRQKNLSYVDQRALVSFEAPLANLLTDFYDQLKSITSGYGSFNYELDNYRTEDLVRVDFYVAGEKVDALSVIVHRNEAQNLGRTTVEKLKDIIPRQNFQVALQAAIGGKFIAREDLSAYRKDVTTGLYGGDVSRKKKVLAKQAKGKKRLKRFGKVDIPAEAFTVMLKRD
jgi:GTP-binding protein LepA